MLGISADAMVTFTLRDYGAIPQGFGIDVMRPCDAYGGSRDISLAKFVSNCFACSMAR